MTASLKETIARSKAPSFGTWISSSSLVHLDALRGLGFDWFMIDTEHSHVNPETLAAMVALVGSGRPAPLIRVGDVHPYLIKQALDSGAQGILAPLVNSEAQARAAVAYAKYPPDGVRGVAAAAASRYGLDLPRYLRHANADTLVGVQIETREGLANVDAIAATTGVDLLFVGPQDLTLNLGFVDERTHPKVLEAMSQVVRSCEDHGKIAGTLVVSREEKQMAIDLGFRFVALASDVRFAIEGAHHFLAK